MPLSRFRMLWGSIQCSYFKRGRLYRTRHENEPALGFADLFLAQCRCHGTSDEPSHRYELPTVRLKVFDEFIEFVLGGPSVTLFALSNQMRRLNATRARRASSAETSMPCTAAACVTIVRMKEI